MSASLLAICAGAALLLAEPAAGARRQPVALPETAAAPVLRDGTSAKPLAEQNADADAAEAAPPVEDIPVPEGRPDSPPLDTPTTATPELPAKADEPTPSPEKPAAAAPADGVSAPETPPASAPVPEPKPEPKPDQPDGDDPAPDAEVPPPPPPDPRSDDKPDASGKLPAQEAACRASLTAMGVEFEALPAESDPSGCSIPYPLSVKSLGNGTDLQPAAEMNCAMADAAARFSADGITPLAKLRYGAGLRSVSHASAYVCRPRNGTKKLSEHAFGNALDIAVMTLQNDTAIPVTGEGSAKDGEFLAAVRNAACGPFKTVLGPGSDADHATHFHFDLAPRKNGGTFCQ